MKLRLVDRIEGVSFIGSRESIMTQIMLRFKQYKQAKLLKGVVCINRTWYIG